ncbi:helix-turn-helix transcriptional regulator [Streptomyces sp. WMMB 322]|uniref:helix-turn-helix domain-containing protein n=1 Tax=Streptomyces sp. WMMB 322 TaxID=1286821 RepID=UPI0006E16C88|nr:helix-turn-helix transcriptional regulator [Streptomyces sp. WMMB 322]SCK49739.1 Helix-turn-helix domain-containing protein [Streptomyces sp. WMMB 322]
MTEGEHAAQRTETGDTVDPLLRAIGRQIKFLRERAGLTQPELGERIGYGVDLVSSVERGRRAPKPQFIDGVERVLDARGLLKAVQDDIERSVLPARFRDFARWEKDAASFYSYAPLTVPGLLQTEEYARALIRGHCPPLEDDTIEDRVAARLERAHIFDDHSAPVTSFVIEEAVLRRPVGGRAVMRAQLDWLLDRAKLRNVSLQVMPTSRWEHNGLLGPITLLETKDGRLVAYTEAQGVSSVITERTAVRVYAQRHGIIRTQALDTEESARLVEQLAGDL